VGNVARAAEGGSPINSVTLGIGVVLARFSDDVARDVEGFIGGDGGTDGEIGFVSILRVAAGTVEDGIVIRLVEAIGFEFHIVVLDWVNLEIRKSGKFSDRIRGRNK
jgi:hypothetical protein